MSRLLLIPVGAAGALSLAILGFGCGSIDGADGLFDSGSAGAGGAPSSTVVTTGSTPETTSTTGATTGATSTSTSATSSASTAASTSSASGSSTGTGVVNETLACGDTTCPLGALNACCWSKFGMPTAGGACVNAPAASDGCKTFVANDGLQSRLECQTSAQCDQGTCCGHRTFFNQGNFFYDLVSCVDTCTTADVTLCDPTNPADVCPMVQTQNGLVQGVCKTSTSLPPGYFVCGAPG
jgi:hypothetical protein